MHAIIISENNTVFAKSDFWSKTRQPAPVSPMCSCTATCETDLSLSCERGGYQDPKRCDRCRCPDGFSGTFCQNVAPAQNGTWRYVAIQLPAHLADFISFRGQSPRLSCYNYASLFCGSCGSRWWSFLSLRTLSIHLSLGLPRGFFPHTFIVITSFATFVYSLLIIWPYH